MQKVNFFNIQYYTLLNIERLQGTLTNYGKPQKPHVTPKNTQSKFLLQETPPKIRKQKINFEKAKIDKKKVY